MTAYQPAAWHDLFVTAGGSAAALTGLIFVAVSINLREIIARAHLPVRPARRCRSWSRCFCCRCSCLHPVKAGPYWGPKSWLSVR